MEQTPTAGTEGTCSCQPQTDLVQQAGREPELRNLTPSIDSLTPQILMPSVIGFGFFCYTWKDTDQNLELDSQC